MHITITHDDVERLERYVEAVQNLTEAIQSLTEQNESLEDFRDILRDLQCLQLPTASQIQVTAQHLENLQAVEELQET
jgi:DNA-binding PadR family transcriptional regulator